MLTGVEVSAKALGISLKMSDALNRTALMVKAKSKRATGAETRTMEMEEISRRVREATRGH